MRPDWAAEEEKQRQRLTPRPQIHDPWHRREQPRGHSIFPHGQKSSRSPPTGDAQRAQSGSSGFRCQDTPHSPFSHFPPPGWCQVVGKEEPKSCCRQQNALKGRFPCIISDCAIRLSISRQKLKVSQLSITPRSLLLSVRSKWQKLSSFPPTGVWWWELAWLRQGAGCHAAAKSRITQIVWSYGLRSREKSDAGKHIWETQEAVACAEHQNPWCCSAKYSQPEGTFSLLHREWTQAICHKRAVTVFMARLLMAS